jgi:hypothetical protein
VTWPGQRDRESAENGTFRQQFNNGIQPRTLNGRSVIFLAGCLTVLRVRLPSRALPTQRFPVA